MLGEIYAQALEAAGFKVKKSLDLGSELIAYKALKGGKIDAYPEYTGTALTSFFGVKTADVPRDAQKAYEDAKAGFAKDDITALAPTPFENTYRLGMTKEGAAKIGDPKHLRPQGQGAGPDDLRLPGVQAAPGLPARRRGRVRAEVRASSSAASSRTRCSTPATRTSRSSSRPTAPRQRQVRDPGRRQEVLPAVQRHVRRSATRR